MIKWINFAQPWVIAPLLPPIRMFCFTPQGLPGSRPLLGSVGSGVTQVYISHTHIWCIYIYTFIYFHIYNYIWLYLHMYIHVHEVIDVFGPFSTLALVFYGLARSTSRKTTMVCSLLLFMYVHVFQEANSGWQHLTSERHGRLFANISLRAGGQMLQTRVASLTPSNAGGCGSYRHHCGDVMSQSGNGRAASV